MTTRSITVRGLAAAFVLAAAVLAPQARADDESITLTIKDHRFDPEIVEVPAGKKIKLLVRNEDPTPEEFESYALNREKVIPGGATGIVIIGPLDPGTYEFVGEFNIETAQGKIVAK
jgi:plastocyanin